MGPKSIRALDLPAIRTSISDGPKDTIKITVFVRALNHYKITYKVINLTAKWSKRARKCARLLPQHALLENRTPTAVGSTVTNKLHPMGSLFGRKLRLLKR